MPKIFLSYRRDDSAFVTQAIQKKLQDRFGENSVFMDIDGIPLGVDFQKKIDESVGQCDVLLAMIGDRWVNARFVAGPKMGQRRLEDPEDLVRAEIATALARDIPVIPVLIGKVAMPDIEPGLPPDLADLTKLNGTSVRPGHDLPHDLKTLLGGVKRLLGLPPLTYDDLLLPKGSILDPKGLRSFEKEDAGVFASLLPGPFREGGLPESIYFWKSRIETQDPDLLFRVGAIYGPSGCGKSSLVKAGLLPHLDSEHIVPVMIEASRDGTEERLLAALHKNCLWLRSEAMLKSALMRKDLMPAGRRLLIVLDQFEQYLHATPDDDQSDFADALRECDGRNLQCIILVRDDFLTPVTRFMNRLQIPLAGDRNLAMIDLFDKRHAKKVLALLGQAYGALRPLVPGGGFNEDQDAFLNRAISGLAVDDHVIPVRLALFAQMMKDKRWTPAALKAAGGAHGVGLAFLEDAFSEKGPNPEIHRHQAAAQEVLAALLPEPGTSIRGAMRSRRELLERSGYGREPAKFDELMEILNKNLRLVTPTEPVATQTSEIPAKDDKYYQLTHDYLVKALETWLRQKKDESWRGRAELRLAERSELWNKTPQSRHLPPWWEYINCRLSTQTQKWTPPQTAMMRAAAWHHGVRGGIVLAFAAVLAVIGYQVNGYVRTTSLVQALKTANISDVPNYADQLDRYRGWAMPALEKIVDTAADDSQEKLNASLALLRNDPKQVPYLQEQLLEASPVQLIYVRRELWNYRSAVKTPLWTLLKDEHQDADRRFRAACALALYDPDNSDSADKALKSDWQNVSPFVADQMVVTISRNYQSFDSIVAALAPEGDDLKNFLAAKARDKTVDLVRTSSASPGMKSAAAPARDTANNGLMRGTAAAVFVLFAADDPALLADALADVSGDSNRRIFHALDEHGAVAIGELERILASSVPATATEDEKQHAAKRHAAAAVALVQMGAPEKVWAILQEAPQELKDFDPTTRNYFIHLASRANLDPRILIAKYKSETGIPMRRSLLLGLGEYDQSKLDSADRDSLTTSLLALYESEPDSGLHAAVEWLLRKWGHDKDLDTIDAGKKENEESLRKRGPEDHRQWYLDSQGQTMVMLPAAKFYMGSPKDEYGRFPDEGLSDKGRNGPFLLDIDHAFAMQSKPVTRDQFQKFLADNHDLKEPNTKGLSRTLDSPQVAVTWYLAVRYCNWLSKTEGIPPDQWCYQPNPDGTYREGMQPAKDYLKLVGYRLPLEPEWEFACRAGTTTSRYFGWGAELLPNYAWYIENIEMTAMPVGRLKPNDFGLFDMLGNAWQWCDDPYKNFLVYDNTGHLSPTDPGPLNDSQDNTRELRGGAFYLGPAYVRSSCRFSMAPLNQNPRFGFRVARTLKSDSPPSVPAAAAPAAAAPAGAAPDASHAKAG